MATLAGAVGEPRVTRGRLIYLTGADGTGKTTQAQLILQRLRREGIRCRHLWLRFPFLSSVPLLVYARWRGYSWYEEVDGVRHGYWDFRSSTALRHLLPWTLLLDAALAALVRIWLPLLRGYTVVCERFVLDMLVDLALALVDDSFWRRAPGTLYPLLLPRGSTVVALDLSLDTIRERRADLQGDRGLGARLHAFGAMARDLSLLVLSSESPAEMVQQQILNIVGVTPHER
jgi:thymidylate kinase